MTITAEVIADSRHWGTGSRLTTMRIRYPRFIHSEFMTHRTFSRNSASSRAIPSVRMRKSIRNDPAMPLSWGRNQKGMQQGPDLPYWRAWLAGEVWLTLMYFALASSWLLEKLGLSKALSNRLLEPWAHITVVVTGTDAAYANFYALRRHEAAEPTIHALADAMAAAHRESVPKVLECWDWHRPFITAEDEANRAAGNLEDINGGLLEVSVARVARTSYDHPDGRKSSYAEDFALYERLVGSKPLHASPAEHQAMAAPRITELSGNFGRGSGWIQYRKLIDGENATDFERYVR